MRIESVLNKYIPERNQFTPPAKKKRVSKKSQTLGKVITDEEASKHVAVIYLATINERFYYVGSKLFDGGECWTNYQTSSDRVKWHIEIGDSVKWEVLQFIESTSQIKPCETKWIRYYMTKGLHRLLNRADAQGCLLRSPGV